MDGKEEIENNNLSEALLNHTQKEDRQDTLILEMKKNVVQKVREKQPDLSYTKHTITNFSIPLKLTGIIITNFRAPL